MNGESDEQTLARFVLRARRVAAHSLVQDRTTLPDHARNEFRGIVDESGKVSITRRLPPDEEIFESLAARVRPLTLPSEPIHYVKVFEALDRQLSAAGTESTLRERMEELRKAWQVADIQGTDARGYVVQSARIDGTEVTNFVSDTQLAAAWLYADLVHSDATGPKSEAMAFPLVERYAAAARLFSQIASLTVATLQLVESMKANGLITVPADAWQEDVVVGESSFTQEVRAFIAPLGSEMPDLRESIGFGDEWRQLSVTELLRQNPGNRAHVSLVNDDYETVASYEAAVVRRAHETTAEWTVIVGGCAAFKFTFDRTDDRLSNCQLDEWEVLDSTNELRLKASRLLIAAHRSATMAFYLSDEHVIALQPPRLSNEDLFGFEVLAEVLGDLLAIERLSGQALTPCDGVFNAQDRVQLRCTRLLWEGQVVRATSQPMTVTTASAAPPQVVVSPSRNMQIGGTLVPVPTTFFRHPLMSAAEVAASSDPPGAGPTKYTVSPPEGECFVAWSPDHVLLQHDTELVVTAPWDLLGIDEEIFGRQTPVTTSEANPSQD